MPIDRGMIDQQLVALGESQRWWELREFRDLPTVMHADERILSLARGKVARLRWLRRRWLIVVTDRRLLCLRAARRAGWRQLEMSTARISRVALRIGPFHARVIVTSGGRTQRMLVARAAGYRLSHALSTLAPHPQESSSSFRPALIARRVIDHVLALPAAALGPETVKEDPPALPADTTAMEDRIETLEAELEETRRQVQFLEQLLQQQHDARASAGTTQS